jgi:hypothetical protein
VSLPLPIAIAIAIAMFLVGWLVWLVWLGAYLPTFCEEEEGEGESEWLFCFSPETHRHLCEYLIKVK